MERRLGSGFCSRGFNLVHPEEEDILRVAGKAVSNQPAANRECRIAQGGAGHARGVRSALTDAGIRKGKLDELPEMSEIVSMEACLE